MVVKGALVRVGGAGLNTGGGGAVCCVGGLANDPPYDVSPITDVYFGHTHAPFAGYRSGGLTFHNTGSAIRGMAGGLLPVVTRGAWERDR